MSKPLSPYRNLSDNAYWRTAVSSRHYYELADLSGAIPIALTDKIATAGSCFAQHIGRHLKNSGAFYMDMEPKPEFISEVDSKRFGYNTYSCRYGNIYTTRQLKQLAEEALRGRVPVDYVWTRDGRYFDALRPSVDPVGYETPEHIVVLRQQHLKAVRTMFEQLDVFVFTLGLTEAWVSNLDGTVYPTAAGTIIGSHDPDKYHFVNFKYNDVMDDLTAFVEMLRTVNPSAKILLTVSPVPLNATATGEHVMVATNRSKATLRAVAADFVENVKNAFYFPSYDIIASHPSRGMFYDPDLRNVNDMGVSFVMKHFFNALQMSPAIVSSDDDEIVCDESHNGK
jgi:hypothetical protein